MPFLETPEELAEQIADWVGRWGAGPGDEDHPDDCKCRLCFVGEVERRIRASVENARRLTPSEPPDKLSDGSSPAADSPIAPETPEPEPDLVIDIGAAELTPGTLVNFLVTLDGADGTALVRRIHGINYLSAEVIGRHRSLDVLKVIADDVAARKGEK